MGQNEPKNEPEKLFKISSCGKTEPEQTEETDHPLTSLPCPI